MACATSKEPPHTPCSSDINKVSCLLGKNEMNHPKSASLSSDKIELKNASTQKYTFRQGSFKDTSYQMYPDILEEWEEYYLPDKVKMNVFGVLENFPCDSADDELVLMTSKDGKVYGYEDELLHLVASSKADLFKSGIEFPSTKQFYRGQRFEDMTDDDWKELKEKSEMMKTHKEFLKTLKLY